MPYKPRRTFIPIEVLETYLTICETGSFTRASEALGLTQPAVSAQIKRLQQLVGGELLSKTGGALRQSEKEKQLQKYARRILQLNDEILNLSGFGKLHKAIRIGLAASFSEILLIDAYNACTQVADTAHSLKFKCASSDDLMRDVENGFIDFALIIHGSDHNMKVAAEWSEELVWVRSPNLVVRPGSPVPIVSMDNSYLYRLALATIERHELNATLRFVGGDLLSCYNAVKAGLGFMAIPLRARTPDLRIAMDHFLPELPRVQVSIVLRDGFETDGSERLLSAFTNAVAKPSPRKSPPDMMPPAAGRQACAAQDCA